MDDSCVVFGNCLIFYISTVKRFLGTDRLILIVLAEGLPAKNLPPGFLLLEAV